MTKLFVAGDPTWANGFSNLADAVLGDIKAEGDREVRQSSMALRSAQTRKAAAEAAGKEGQNAVRTMTALKAAGYSDAEAAAIIATGDNSVSSVFKGVNYNRGRTSLEGGNPAVALPLLGQAAGYDDYVKGETQRKLTTNADGSFNSPVAAALAGGVKDIGGAATTIDPTGKPVQGFTTPEGAARVDLLKTQGINDTNRTTSQNSVDAARAGAITKTGDANVDLIGKRGAAVDQGANDKSRLADAVIENRGNESNARVNRINANIDNDALKATASAAKGTDPVKAANAQATLRAHIDGIYAKDFSEKIGTNAWESVDPVQKKKITDRALRYVVKNGMDLGSAMEKSEADHGLTGKTVKGQKDKLWGLTKTPDGKITFDGFRDPVDSDSAAGVMLDALRAGAAAPASPAAPAAPAAPAPVVPVAPVAPVDPAAPAAAEAVPPAAQRVPGQVYSTPRGPFKWTGTGWVSP